MVVPLALYASYGPSCMDESLRLQAHPLASQVTKNRNLFGFRLVVTFLMIIYMGVCYFVYFGNVFFMSTSLGWTYSLLLVENVSP
jgi:hypothetical protein